MQKESQRHNDKGRAKTSLKNISLTLFVTFACERELKTEQNCNILTPTLMAISVVSFSFSRAAQPEAQRSTLLGAGFLYRILSPTGLVPKLHRGPKDPFGRVWLSLPHLISNSSELQFADFLSSPSYIIVQSPTQSLEWHVWSSSSGNNCHAVQRSLSSGTSVYECIIGFYLVPFRQPSPPTRFLLITAIGMCHFLPMHHIGMACLAGSKVIIQQCVWRGLLSSEMNSEIQIQILNETECTSLCTNALAKGMNPSFLLSAMADWAL